MRASIAYWIGLLGLLKVKSAWQPRSIHILIYSSRKASRCRQQQAPHVASGVHVCFFLSFLSCIYLD